MVLENLPYFANLGSHIRALILFIVLFVVLRLGLYLIQIIFIKLSLKTSTDLDDILLKRSSKPLNFVALLISFFSKLFPNSN